MSRVVFMNVSAAGHIIPTFGLVTELIQRGEEVIYYEDARFQTEIEKFGATFRCYPPVNPATVPPVQNELSLVSSMMWYTKEVLPTLLEAVKQDNPDYIVHDSLCLWGRLIAQLLNIPAINSIATAAFTPETFYQCSWSKKQLPQKLKAAAPSIKYYWQYQRELRKTYNLPPIKFVDVFTNPEPVNICHLAPEIQPYVEKFDQTFHFVGPCNPVRAAEYDFSMEQLQREKLIYISFGNIHDPGLDFYKSCIEAFGNIDADVLVLLSPATDINLLGDIPQNFIIKPTGTVPQLKILERASLFIMHGAGGGTREGVWYSVPMIAIPQTYEQEIISRKMTAQGAGVMILPSEVTAKTLKETAELIMNNPSFRVNSGRLGDACRAAGGVEKAVEEIFKYIYKQYSREQGTGNREQG